jgi:hypothetical protein
VTCDDRCTLPDRLPAENFIFVSRIHRRVLVESFFDGDLSEVRLHEESVPPYKSASCHLCYQRPDWNHHIVRSQSPERSEPSDGRAILCHCSKHEEGASCQILIFDVDRLQLTIKFVPVSSLGAETPLVQIPVKIWSGSKADTSSTTTNTAFILITKPLFTSTTCFSPFAT